MLSYNELLKKLYKYGSFINVDYKIWSGKIDVRPFFINNPNNLKYINCFNLSNKRSISILEKKIIALDMFYQKISDKFFIRHDLIPTLSDNVHMLNSTLNLIISNIIKNLNRNQIIDKITDDNNIKQTLMENFPSDEFIRAQFKLNFEVFNIYIPIDGINSNYKQLVEFIRNQPLINRKKLKEETNILKNTLILDEPVNDVVINNYLEYIRSFINKDFINSNSIINHVSKIEKILVRNRNHNLINNNEFCLYLNNLILELNYEDETVDIIRNFLEEKEQNVEIRNAA